MPFYLKSYFGVDHGKNQTCQSCTTNQFIAENIAIPASERI